MFRENLSKIIQRKDLNETEMSQMITEIFSGEITDEKWFITIWCTLFKCLCFDFVSEFVRKNIRESMPIFS